MMDFETFRHNIELYSGDLSRWPQALIRDAAQLAEKDPRAKALLEAHVSFDAVMRQYAPSPSTPRLQALESRILQQIAVLPQGAETVIAPISRGTWRPAWLMAPGGGLIAAALIGFLIGFHPQPQKDILLDPGYYNDAQVVASNDAATDNVDIDTDGDGDNDGGIF